MNKDILISFVICTNRAPAATDELLWSIAKQKFIERCEVVFVATGLEIDRADDVQRRLAALPCPTKYVSENTCGIWPARNTSYQNTIGRWLFILDDDNILMDDAVEKFHIFMDKHPEVGGICPSLIARWEEKPPEWLRAFGHLFMSYNESGKYKIKGGERVWLHNEGLHVVPPGGGMIIRKEVVTAFLKSFHEMPASLTGDAGLGAEDFPLYKFVNRCGLATAFVPSIRILHDLPANRMKMSFLVPANFRMTYAYGQLEYAWERNITLFFVAKKVLWFTINCIFFPPVINTKALWLKWVRISGYAAGLWKVYRRKEIDKRQSQALG